MATTGEETAQPPPKRPRHDVVRAEPKPAAARVELNPADCNLDFEIDGGGLRGHALHGGAFAYCWSGARATVGFRGGGRYCFGCKVLAEQTVQMEDTDADQRHLCRVGFSRGDDSVGGLGDSGHSFAFGGTGKFSHRGKFFDYGAKFGVGDTIVCAVDLNSKPMASIGFSKNGEWLGVAQFFDASETGLGLVDAPVKQPMQWESAIFPHVLLKNVVVEMQFSREDGLEPLEGYEPWSSACAGGNAVCGPVFAEQGECEVMMMVGLPASGKSTWAEKWVKNHPQKRFLILGFYLALEQLKMTRFLYKQNYEALFDCWMHRGTTILNTLVHRAANIPHNYIIDRTHLNKIERIRTLSPFMNYRKTAIVVFPSLKKLKDWSAKAFQGTWKQVPDQVVDKLAANFVLPLPKDVAGSLEAFDEVIFVELNRDSAERFLDLFRPSSAKYGTQVTSTSMGSASGCESTSGSTAGSSNARDKQPISTKDAQVDDDFVLFKKFDLYEEYESMDLHHGIITELSNSAETTKEELDALWDIFRARIKKCREIQREIRAAKGSYLPIPERFLN